MDRNVKIKFNKQENSIHESYKFFDFSDYQISSKEDLAEVCDVFRSGKYETFRILYMRENQIVGQESITNKLPNSVIIFKDMNSNAKFYEKMKYRMQRLNADGYYLTHNHPTYSSKPSEMDIKLTKKMDSKVDGFLGHIILNNSNKYSFIEKDEFGCMQVTNENSLSDKELDSMSKKLISNTPFDIKVHSRTELVSLLMTLKREKEYSTAVLTDCKGIVRMILDVPDRMFNDQLESVNGYFKNIARECGSTRVFVGTQNKDVYEKLYEHQKYGTIKDVVCLETTKNKIKNYFGRDYLQEFDLFDLRNERNLAEDNENIYEKGEIVMEDKLKILLKKVGQEPKEMEIDNTLEAKQELVGGLIEVVPYEEVLLICNEEGKILNMPPNLSFDYDYIAGDCFVVGDDYENGDFRSLTKDEIEKISKDLKQRSFKYLEFMEKPKEDISRIKDDKEVR